MFDILFSLDRGNRRIVLFIINQHFYAISLRKSLDQALAVFVNPANQIICNAHVQCSSWFACEQVDPELHTPPPSAANLITGDAGKNLTTVIAELDQA
jgi:hypothetical protein